MTIQDPTRRGFLRRSGALSLGAMSAPWVMNLAGMAEAAAAQASPTDDYKALVCVFLHGGNDQGNTIIPVSDADYALYAKLRGALALPKADLLAQQLTPVNAASAATPTLALPKALEPLHALFNDKQRLAVLLNIGPLHQPTDKAQFLGRKVELPDKLFSHNDQQSAWQSYGAEGSTTGWGGLIGDAGVSMNATTSLTCVNLAGNAVYLAGRGANAGQFMVDPHGPVPLLVNDDAQLNRLFGPTDTARAAFLDAFQAVVRTEEPSVHRLAKEHSAIMRRAMNTNGVLMDALAGVTSVPVRQGGDNPLLTQLNTAARIMAAHKQLGANGGVKRQVFFVALGGFDTHDNFQRQHPTLLKNLADALKQLDADLEAAGLLNQVTTFTASDFGRTLTSNGDGSDHGWGSHHFVMGGAVQGGRLYGSWPDVTGFDTGEHNIGQGRLLPTMSVDHLAAALAGWMGVTDPAALQQIAPHLANFPGASPLSALF